MRNPYKDFDEYGLRYLPDHLIEIELWEEVEHVLTDLFFLEAKTEAGFVFDLARDFTEAIHSMPTARPKYRILQLLGEALWHDMAFLHECPIALCQSLRNMLSIKGHEGVLGLHDLLRAFTAGSRGRHYLIAIQSESNNTGRLFRKLTTPHSEITALALFADELQFATGGCEGTICTWDRGRQTMKLQLARHDDAIKSLAIHPCDQSILSASNDGSVRISDPMSQYSKIIASRKVPCFAVAISPNGRWLAAGWYDGAILLWRTDNFQTPVDICGPEFCVRCLVFSSDSTLLAAGTDDLAIFVWSLDRISPSRPRVRFAAHELEINDIIFLQQNQLLASASSDRTTRLWDWKSACCVQVLKGHKSGVFAIATKDDGEEIATGGSDNTIRLWNKPFHSYRESLLGHARTITSLKYLKDGTLLSVAKDKTIREWNLMHTERQSQPPRVHTLPRCVCISRDGGLAVAGHSDGSVTAWEPDTATCLATQKVSDFPITRVSTSRSGGSIVAGCETGDLWVLTPDLRISFEVDGSEELGAVKSLAISAPGDVVAVAYNRSRDSYATASIWRPAEKKQVGTIRHSRSGDHIAIAIDDEGRFVAVGSYGCATIYEAFSQRIVGRFRAFNGEVVDLAFGISPSRLSIATKYATRVGDVDNRDSWEVMPRGGPARAIARPTEYPFWLTFGRNNCLWQSTKDGTVWGGLPGVPMSIDISGGESPILAVVEDNKLSFYRWSRC